MERIDAFCHIIPRRYYDYMVHRTSRGDYMQKRIRGIPALTDLDERFRLMDRHPGYRQVLSLAAPPVEALGSPDETPDMARVANDGMAELVAAYPDRFAAFVASLPLNNPDASVAEAERAITQLGARGVQIFTNVNGAPLDTPVYEPLFERVTRHGLPIWVHPTRPPSFADYATEGRSRYDLWWAFGWPYETSVFMARMVFWGIFDRMPGLKIITHHMGGLVPYLEGRVGWGLDQLGTRTDDPDDLAARQRLERRPYDYFRMFYADTALFGALPATECGLAFFGSERVLFATDFPFDPQGGGLVIGETIRVVDNLTASLEDKCRIYHGNVRRLLRLDVSVPARASSPEVDRGRERPES